MSTLDPQTKKIITRLLDDVLAAEWLVSIDVGEDELELALSDDREQILDRLNATGQDTLILTRPGSSDRPEICLVYGNEPYEVISDYTVSITPLLAGAQTVADQIEQGHCACKDVTHRILHP